MTSILKTIKIYCPPDLLRYFWITARNVKRAHTQKNNNKFYSRCTPSFKYVVNSEIQLTLCLVTKGDSTEKEVKVKYFTCRKIIMAAALEKFQGAHKAKSQEVWSPMWEVLGAATKNLGAHFPRHPRVLGSC